MALDGKTLLGELLEKHPFLIEFLPVYNPMYAPLKNPELRANVAKTATLDMASKMGQIPLDKLIKDLEAAIEMNSSAPKQAPLSKEERAQVLKGLIQDLHAGVDFMVIKRRFADLVKNISPNEISDMEQSLMNEGMPKDEIKKLCDVHVAIFKDALNVQEPVPTKPGHPIHTFMAENKALSEAAEEFRKLLDGLDNPPLAIKYNAVATKIDDALAKLSFVDKHYVRKENQLFPFLEKHGITGPSQVMWAIHDDIRVLLKKTLKANTEKKLGELQEHGAAFVTALLDMVYKEEHILFPMSNTMLSEDEWSDIRRGEHEIGYALVTPGDEWKPLEKIATEAEFAGRISLNTGAMTIGEINLVMNHLPLEFTFVDAEDRVRFYSSGKERIFPRSPGIIGRNVQNCHPPKSLHVVNKIVGEFKSGKKDHADFWIKIQGKTIYIRYFAVRDDKGVYQGCLEVTQDITEITKIQGERRLLNWEEDNK